MSPDNPGVSDMWWLAGILVAPVVVIVLKEVVNSMFNPI